MKTGAQTRVAKGRQKPKGAAVMLLGQPFDDKQDAYTT